MRERSPQSDLVQRKKGLEEEATVQGFKYPWTHAWSDIV
jgi:hypothetical protein